MPQFFDPKARVVFSSIVQPHGGVRITTPNWDLQNSEGIPMAMLPLRRSYNNDMALPGEGIVHVSTLTGERHVHGELHEVSNEPGMERVVAEDVRPQRPLGSNEYHQFAQELRHAYFQLFQRQVIRAIEDETNLSLDNSAVSASYLTPP